MPHPLHRVGDALLRAARIEMLERRMLLSLSPAGAEFRVNSFTTGVQQIPTIASDADGDFVVVWEGNGATDNGGVFAQRYNAAGVAQGGEFRVNTTTAAFQGQTAVAMDADGDFVVVWGGNGPGDNAGIFAQRFDAAGVARGGEFRVNTFTTSGQALPAVAMDSSGNFVVAWSDLGQDGSGSGVYAQRYNASGVAQGSEFHVSTTTTNDQTFPTVAMDSDGDFVVAWQGNGFGDNFGVFAQRYSAAGVAQGAESRVNTVTTGTQAGASIAMDASGGFVVTWFGDQDPASTFGIYAQRFNAAGLAQGSEFRVNATTTGHQLSPSVAMDADGDFLVAWESIGQDGSGYGVYAQSFNATGVPQGGEFRVNSVTADAQKRVSAAMDAEGDAVVVWQSNLQDGSGYGIYAQRYDESNPDTAAPLVGGLFIASTEVLPAQRVENVAITLILSFSENMSSAGSFSNYRLTRNGVDISSQINSSGFSFNSTTRKFQVSLSFSAPLQDGSYVLTARDTLRDLAGNALDGNFDGMPGGDFTRAFSVVLPVAVGPEFRVNVTTALDQFVPAVAMDAAGNFVVVWQSEDQDGSFDGIYGRRYSAAGTGLSAEFRINAVTTNFQRNPAIARNADGDFVVAWDGSGPGDTDGIFARRYNSNGLAKDGIEFRVNTYTTSRQQAPAVAIDAAGNFVIAWESRDQEFANDFGGIYAQRFNAAGVAQGGEIHVNTTSADIQISPTVALDIDGDFIIAWNDGGVGMANVFAQRFAAAGVPQGVEFLVSPGDSGSDQGFLTYPTAGMDSAGNFVIAWTNDAIPFARRYNAAGAPLGPPAQVSTFGTGAPEGVALDADGDFTVVWASSDVVARRFNSAGVPQADQFRVNTFTPGDQRHASVAMDADGDFVIAWQSENQDGSGYGIYAQRYARVPEVNISNFLFEIAPHRLQFTFNDNVSASLGIDDIVLQNLTTMQTIPSTDVSVSYDGGTNTATFSYTGSASGFSGVLPDGNYRATLLASGINNPGGTPLQQDHLFNFFFQNGDANHDGRVNLSDFNILAANFGQSPRNFSQGDFNYDTFVNLTDFNILAGRFGQVLGPDAFGRDPIGGMKDRDDQRQTLEALT